MTNSETRYSNPETIYSQISSGNPLARISDATQALCLILGVNCNLAGEDEARLSSELIRTYGEDSGEPRPMHTVISRILGLMQTYPFLIPSRDKQFPPKPDKFREWACNHIFDDLPGLYGISDSEGHRLRSHAQHEQIYEGAKPFMVNYQEACRQIIETVDLNLSIIIDS